MTWQQFRRSCASSALICLLAGGLAGCSRIPAVYVKCYTENKLKPLTISPTFAGKGMDGSTIALSQYRGKVVLLDFWSTGCSPCVAQLPHITQVYQKYHPLGLEVIGITIDHNPATLKHFVKARQMPWPQIVDSKNTLTNASVPDGHGIPMTVLFDRQGVLVAADLVGTALETRVEAELKK